MKNKNLPKLSIDYKSELKKLISILMIKVGLIGMGIGQKHLEAIDGYRNCKVVSIFEKIKIKF